MKKLIFNLERPIAGVAIGFAFGLFGAAVVVPLGLYFILWVLGL